MKMLKKAGAIAIAGAMVMSLGTISAFAEGEATTADPIVIDKEITINPVLNEAGEKTGVLEVTVPYTVNASGVDQVTLLAEFGDSEAFTNKIDYTTTAYIDQKADDSKAFTFKINENRLIPEGTTKNVYLNVKIGGNGVAKAAEGHKEAYKYVEPEVPTTPITSADVRGALEVKDGAPVTWVAGNVNAGIMRLDATDLITADAEGKVALDLATQVVKIDGVEARYTVYNGVTKLVALVDTAKENVVEIVAKDGGSTELIYGDSNGDISLDAADLSSTIKKILGSVTLSGLSDYNHFAADANGDISVDAADLSVAIKDILNETYIPGAAK